MKLGDVVADAYRLDEVLGRGAHGTTWRATRLADASPVCIKALHLHHVGSFDAERLFEREGRVLRQLDHPGVPDFVETLTLETDSDVVVLLVQELIAGRTLAAELDDRRYTEDEVVDVLRDILQILTYLHGLSPPVVHRDIKPANVMRRPDGSLVLVDFGAVKDVIRETISGGATIAGTFGFMAPEQLYGRATPASDLYAIGATALALLARVPPADMVDARNRLAWRDHVQVSARTEAVLDALLDPDPLARPQSAAEVLGLLDAPAAPAPTPAPPARLPSAARAPQPSSDQKGGKLVALSLVLVVCGALAVIGLATTSSPTPDEATTTHSPAPQGLKGLTFGMTVDQAIAALPALATAEDKGPGFESTWGIGSMLSTVEVPGPRFDVSTTLVGTDATCELHFAVDATLSRMDCTLAPVRTLESHKTVEGTLVDALERRYGPAHTSTDDDPMALALPGQHEATWTWSDSNATLTVSSKFSDYGAMMHTNLDPDSTLRVDNVWRRHEQAIDAIAQKARAAERKKNEALEAAERARIEAARKAGAGDDI